MSLARSGREHSSAPKMKDDISQTAPTENGALQLARLLEWLDQFDLARHPDVETRARLLLLDTIACITSGLAKPEPARLARQMALTAPGASCWPGQTRGTSISETAFIGALAACWDEACEGHAHAHGRPGLHSVPAAVALATSTGCSLGQLLEAIVKAYEIGGRLGASMRIRPGMHVDGTWGLLVSTVAACYMLSASRQVLEQALLMAACQMPCSLYLPITEGCIARNTYPAHAASTGIQLAQAALAGFDAPATALTECDRLTMASADRHRWSSVEDLSRMYILDGYLKPYAAVRHVHYPVSGAVQWWRKHGGDAATRIERVVLETYAEAIVYCSNRAPSTALQAQFSLTYGTAFALRTGELGPDAYSEQALRDPGQKALEARIEVHEDPSMQERGAKLTIICNSSREAITVTKVPGDPGLPMDDRQVTDKAMSMMTPVIGSDLTNRLIESILLSDLESQFDLGKMSQQPF